MAPDDWPDWLPAGWTMQIRKVDQRSVKCYLDPEGHKCYSKPQVFDYLKKINKSTGNEETHNADDSVVDLSLEPNDPHTNEIPESLPVGEPTKLTKLTPRSSRRKSEETGGFLAGDGSSSEPLSSARSRDSEWLPDGWTVEVKIRKSGSSNGMRYKCYTDPLSGQKFFSKPQVLNYLAKTNSSAGGHLAKTNSSAGGQTEGEKSSTEPDNSQTYEATEVKKNKTEKKTENVYTDYEVISRTPADDLPPGWIKEIRMRKRGYVNKKDPYYLDPSSEYVFLSKKDVLRYLDSGDVTKCVIKPLKRDMKEDESLNVNLTLTEEDLASPPDPSIEIEPSEPITNGCVPELKTDENGTEIKKPIRSITGGIFSTPDPVWKVEASDWLPDGWTVNVNVKSSGMKYKVFTETATGRKFYSKPQVLNYLANGFSSNSRKRKENKLSASPDSSQNNEDTDVTRPIRSKKKKGNIQNSDYEEVIVTSPADGLPPGWIKEVRTKIYATHKRHDPFYTDPVSGYIFRSKLDALRYLDTGDVNLCAIRPKIKDKDGNEVSVFTHDMQKPIKTTAVPTTDVTDPNTADITSDSTPTRGRASTRITNQNKSPTTLPPRSITKQKGINLETHPDPSSEGPTKLSGVNMEKPGGDVGHLSFELPEDDSWTDQCLDFAVKTLTSEILFNGQPTTSGAFPEENVGVNETQRKVN